MWWIRCAVDETGEALEGYVAYGRLAVLDRSRGRLLIAPEPQFELAAQIVDQPDPILYETESARLIGDRPDHPTSALPDRTCPATARHARWRGDRRDEIIDDRGVTSVGSAKHAMHAAQLTGSEVVTTFRTIGGRRDPPHRLLRWRPGTVAVHLFGFD